MAEAVLLARATRVKTLPVMLSPVAVGAAAAWHRGVPFTWIWFGLTLVGAAAMHLGANVINDYFDERSGADKLARIDRTAVATGSGLIESGAMSARAMLRIAGVLFGVALAIGIALAAARGPMVLAIGGAGAFLAFAYAGPPVRYGYRGRGLGEAGIFVAFGLLPVVGAYFVQAQRIDAVALWSSVVPGILTMLVVYHHHFLHWRADKAAGKMTPVAVLGPETALMVSGAIITIAYVALIVQVALGLFPAWALLAVITAVPLAASWSRALRDPAVQHCLNLLGATLGASVLTGAVLTVSLILAR